MVRVRLAPLEAKVAVLEYKKGCGKHTLCQLCFAIYQVDPAAGGEERPQRPAASAAVLAPEAVLGVGVLVAERINRISALTYPAH